MDLYKRQQFEFLLQTAVERWVERLEQRFRGADRALDRIQAGLPSSELEGFVDAVFQDFLLDNCDGACFILQSLPQRRVGNITWDATLPIETLLIRMAKDQFSKLLSTKTIEMLEQHSGYEPVDMGADHQ
jgi:hypothetical protein